MKLYIRNMACESCKVVVKEALTKLNLHPVRVELGEADIKENIKDGQKQKLNNEIKKAGLEVVESNDGIIIERIRKCIIEYVSAARKPKVNFSDYLSKKLKYDYNYLSNMFSEIEACTITHYMNSVKMERIREVIMFEDLTLSQIAEKFHFSNPSNFSTQFKRITGFSPSHFGKLKEKRRRTMQSLSGGI
ncbi:MAG: helix-turn-helix domain-containing protein [Bacteroidia bacterium]